MNDAAAEFREIRRSLGLSQVEMAALMGVKQPTISRWENGDPQPATRTLIALRAIAGMQRAAA